MEWPMQVVEEEEEGATQVDAVSGRQLVQNTVALITANPALVLVFAFSVSKCLGFDLCCSWFT